MSKKYAGWVNSDELNKLQSQVESLNWVELKKGTALPPRDEKVLIYIEGEIRYQELEYGENEYGENTVGPNFTHFARVTPPMEKSE